MAEVWPRSYPVRVWVRGHENVRKRVVIQAAACNIGLLLRQTGVGTSRSLRGRVFRDIRADRALERRLNAPDERLGAPTVRGAA